MCVCAPVAKMLPFALWRRSRLRGLYESGQTSIEHGQDLRWAKSQRFKGISFLVKSRNMQSYTLRCLFPDVNWPLAFTFYMCSHDTKTIANFGPPPSPPTKLLCLDPLSFFPGTRGKAQNPQTEQMHSRKGLRCESRNKIVPVQGQSASPGRDLVSGKIVVSLLFAYLWLLTLQWTSLRLLRRSALALGQTG